MQHYTIAALIAAATCLGASQALACACCAEPGERLVYQGPVDDFFRADLDLLKPDGPANVYVNACDLDCVDGIANTQYDYPVRFATDSTSFTLSTGAGTLRLSLPESFTGFSVDTDPFGDTQVVELYKELRLQGPLAATGDFKAADGVQAELVIAGRGNACTFAPDLGHWSLDVTGTGVNFRLYGRLGE